MTEIVVATRSGILTDPAGIKHRLVAGKTLAHATHPGVVANPRNFQPMTIDLVDPGSVAAIEADAEATELAGELHDVTAQRDEYRETLAEVAQVVIEGGYPERFGIDVERPGWLAETVRLALAVGDPATVPATAQYDADGMTDGGRAGSPHEAEDEAPVAAPKRRPGRPSRKVAGDAEG